MKRSCLHILWKFWVLENKEVVLLPHKLRISLTCPSLTNAKLKRNPFIFYSLSLLQAHKHLPLCFLWTVFFMPPPAESHKRVYSGLFCHNFVPCSPFPLWLPDALISLSFPTLSILRVKGLFFTVSEKRLLLSVEQTFYYFVLFLVHICWYFQNRCRLLTTEY